MIGDFAVFGRTPRVLTDAELREIAETAGCTFGEGENPYYIVDLLVTARRARLALADAIEVAELQRDRDTTGLWHDRAWRWRRALDSAPASAERSEAAS